MEIENCLKVCRHEARLAEKTVNVTEVCCAVIEAVFAHSGQIILHALQFVGAVGIKKTRFAVHAGLFADVVGVPAALFICRLLSG